MQKIALKWGASPINPLEEKMEYRLNQIMINHIGPKWNTQGAAWFTIVKALNKLNNRNMALEILNEYKTQLHPDSYRVIAKKIK